MKTAIYVRTSTIYQKNTTKLENLTSFSKENSWDIHEVYEDVGYNGSDLNRPAIQKLITDLDNNKFDILLVYKLSDLARSSDIIADLLLKAKNIVFISRAENINTSTEHGKQIANIWIEHSKLYK